MKNSEKRYRFSEKCSNSYKKCEKVIKLYRNSEKLYEKFSQGSNIRKIRQCFPLKY